MRAATKALILAWALAGLSACGDEPADQNITIDNGIDPNADIEAVPTDETSAAGEADLNGVAAPVENESTGNSAN